MRLTWRWKLLVMARAQEAKLASWV
ncbi:hypothetical protein CSPAE12_04848 [Colletotrichum incanum]|nr:hypothetical protein CSPAE12_04848 [Colletotrichum incanum]